MAISVPRRSPKHGTRKWSAETSVSWSNTDNHRHGLASLATVFGNSLVCDNAQAHERVRQHSSSEVESTRRAHLERQQIIVAMTKRRPCAFAAAQAEYLYTNFDARFRMDNILPTIRPTLPPGSTMDYLGPDHPSTQVSRPVAEVLY